MAATLTKIIDGKPAISDTLTNEQTVLWRSTEQLGSMCRYVPHRRGSKPSILQLAALFHEDTKAPTFFWTPPHVRSLPC